ncbi:DUF3311 domain-containing protein [Achromobacter aloeverae]|uniref:DUF3311 domain-containing protein n=1 Tax=Achromobacter aloeverae TaxID=1750518 RepID=A0A4Q1HDQ8_9BURK|nr:DUF3311 domain-containing protein [Achromobacter aloeverae]RXN82729.1 hypothetical protein C7R54_28520 [Achromobacter aloeverae]
MFKVLIGLVTPFIGVLGLLPWVVSVERPVAGVPFAYFWMFSWFLLTSGCLYLCYRWFDAGTQRAGTQ